MEEDCKEPPGRVAATLYEQLPSSGRKIFDSATNENWNDWKWQFANRLTSADLGNVEFKFPVAITPYYFSLIKDYSLNDPIFSMCMPNPRELSEIMHADPLGEDQMMPVKNLVHRYKDRALIITTTLCSMYCRYCTRKRTVGSKDHILTQENLEEITNYLKSHPEITDVIISGGDPMVFSTKKLEHIIKKIRSVSSVQVIRIGTKVPVVMPMRINKHLASMLSKYHPIYVNTHFNHPNEITPESMQACNILANHGIPVSNQSVLLKGVNDDKYVFEELCRKLFRNRVRPYYLFQCDLVNGVEHFRTRVAQGIEIMEHLRGRLSGMAIPQFIVDSPNGLGKIPVSPNYVLYQTPEKFVLRNYQGKLVEYPEVKQLSP
jgi:lysine 2,3-aminomutase